jgi:hypothetical protein
MSSRARTSKAALAALLTVLVLGSGILPELMDQGFEVRTTLETQHDPADCPRAHDHRVCAQIDRTPGAFTPAQVAQPPLDVARWTMAERLDGLVVGISSAHHPARAPPA